MSRRQSGRKQRGDKESGDLGSGWKWVATKAATRDLAGFPQNVQQRIFNELEQLVTDPRQCDIRKVEGTDNYRLRVGDYRVVYYIEKRSRTCVVSEVAHRKDAYR